MHNWQCLRFGFVCWCFSTNRLYRATGVCVLRGVFRSNHLASTDNLTSNNQETEYIQTQTNVNTKVLLINNSIHTMKPMITERTDRAWFSRRLLRDLARKWSGSILTTPEPAALMVKFPPVICQTLATATSDVRWDWRRRLSPTTSPAVPWRIPSVCEAPSPGWRRTDAGRHLRPPLLPRCQRTPPKNPPAMSTLRPDCPTVSCETCRKSNELECWFVK